MADEVVCGAEDRAAKMGRVAKGLPAQGQPQRIDAQQGAKHDGQVHLDGSHVARAPTTRLQRRVETNVELQVRILQRKHCHERIHSAWGG